MSFFVFFFIEVRHFGKNQYIKKILRNVIIYYLFLYIFEKIFVLHNSKITGAVSPAVDPPKIKASSEKCCGAAIFILIAFKKIILYGFLFV